MCHLTPYRGLSTKIGVKAVGVVVGRDGDGDETTAPVVVPTVD